MARASLEIGNSNQELMEKPGRRKWKVWLSAVIIFVIIVILVAAAVVLLTGSSDAPEKAVSNPITLEDVMSGKLSPNRFNGTWISDDQLLFLDDKGNLMMFNVRTAQKTIIIKEDNPLMDLSFDHLLSPDLKYILFAFNYRKLYRHSYSAQYLIIDLEHQTQHDIISHTNDSFLDLAVWGPHGNSLAFVYKNNIFYKASVLSESQQISTDGVPSVIYNGVPDWVYEEEVFASNKAVWFSDSGSHMAYGTFNDNSTRVMPIPFYGHPGDLESQYTRALTIRYPKAGTTNPNAALVLVSLTDLRINVLPVPTKLHEPILASVSFATNSSVAAVWTNRVQNESVVIFCDSKCTEIFEYNEPKGWIDMLRPLIFISDGTEFFTILPKTIGDDSWRQIALVSRGASDDNPWTIKYITNEKNTVTELVHWDKDSNSLWYMATSANDSALQHLFKVTLDGKIDCFTCKIKHSTGNDCLYNEVSMSKEGSNIIVSCLGPDVPEVYVYAKSGEKLMNWDTNESIAALLQNKSLPVIQRMSVRVTDEPLPPAQVLLMIPPNADLSGKVKYPMLVNVYGGPDSYQVLEKWNMDWGASLVTRWNVIIAQIDGRGSGLKGNNNLFAVYRQLGTVEINDQINVTRRLQNTLNYIDPEKTCIWGWSYGGYASALALSRGGDTFKCAISVAPVTDWLLYDSIYTERYMGLPSEADNLVGYAKAQLNTRETALEINQKKFMLVHGTLDDNVHYQQSMMLSRVLQQNDVLFTQMSYPDEDHGLNGVKHHLYHSIEQFLYTNLISDT